MMSLPVAKALGPSNGKIVLDICGTGSDKISLPIVTLPAFLQTHLRKDQLDLAVEYLKCLHEVASSSPLEEDTYLEQHSDLLPTRVAELLTQAERKEVIDKMIHIRDQSEDHPFGKWSVRSKWTLSEQSSASMTFLEWLYDKKLWLEMLPESKRVLLEKHPLLEIPIAREENRCTGTHKKIKHVRRGAINFYSRLDVTAMPMSVAKALGASRAMPLEKQVRNKVVHPEQSAQHLENVKFAEYIDAHSDLLPRNISIHLSHSERVTAVERLKVMKRISETDPQDQDKFLQENPGIIPITVADFLTQSERKELIKKLILLKKEGEPKGTSVQKGMYVKTPEGRKAKVEEYHGKTCLIKYLSTRSHTKVIHTLLLEPCHKYME